MSLRAKSSEAVISATDLLLIATSLLLSQGEGKREETRMERRMEKRVMEGKKEVGADKEEESVERAGEERI